MCLICDHFNKDLLTLSEAWCNLNEMYDTLDEEHRQEVVENLWHEALTGPEELPPETWDLIFRGILVDDP
jgi:hypothetical protein